MKLARSSVLGSQSSDPDSSPVTTVYSALAIRESERAINVLTRLKIRILVISSLFVQDMMDDGVFNLFPNIFYKI